MNMAKISTSFQWINHKFIFNYSGTVSKNSKFTISLESVATYQISPSLNTNSNRWFQKISNATQYLPVPFHIFRESTF